MKMRNHLAEEALDDNMYNLMVKYRDSLNHGKHLDGTIDMLDQTRKIMEVFRDSRPLCDINDKRLQILQDVETWLINWSDSVSEDEKKKSFLTKETFLDTISMLKGFKQICKIRIQECKRSIVPAGINSDIVENFFCQQRTICHGSTTNPNVQQYKYGINSTILCQTAVSKKSNACPSKGDVHPASFSVEPAKKKKKKQ